MPDLQPAYWYWNKLQMVLLFHHLHYLEILIIFVISIVIMYNHLVKTDIYYIYLRNIWNWNDFCQNNKGTIYFFLFEILFV